MGFHVISGKRFLTLARRLGLISLTICMALAVAGVPGVQAAKAKGKAKDESKTAEDVRPYPVSFEDVVKKAKDMSGQPFKDPKGDVPDFLLKIDYDTYRDIRFNTAKSLWRDDKLPFEVQFFHPGFLVNRTVALHVVDEKKDSVLPFDTSLFNYGPRAAGLAPKIPQELGFAGFRVHYDINEKKSYLDEFLVFLGASYFRAVAKDMHYGMSARGLAIDTASPKGEEFPYFREFWLFKPHAKDKQVTIYALLDSPSVTGAYEFIAQPGPETVIDVRSVVFLRKPVEKVGIAPLTSMFYYGENTQVKPAGDFRPEVHDSDGLSVNFDSGEWLWRPLQNPKVLMVNAFQANNVKGFGLLQRDQNFRDYEDLEASYHRRPSVWVERVGDWGEGNVELVQIPSDKEINDNIVAYFVPKTPAEPGKPMVFNYRMYWHYPLRPNQPPSGYVYQTFAGKGGVPDREEPRMRRIIIDFAGGDLDKIPDSSPPTAVVNVGAGAKLVETSVVKNPYIKGWRLIFQILPDSDGPLGMVLPDTKPAIELRAFLQRGSDVLTETWSYAYRP